MDAACPAVHLEEDRRHWYFRGRLAVLRACLRARLAGRRAQILELGCGSGNVLEALGDLGETVGMEVDPGLLAAARTAGLDVRPGALPDELVVPPGRADVVLLLDVIEHVDADVAALAAAPRALPRAASCSSSCRPTSGSGAGTTWRSGIAGVTPRGSWRGGPSGPGSAWPTGATSTRCSSPGSR
jgi:SAM-dependent methyltransferase